MKQTNIVIDRKETQKKNDILNKNCKSILYELE